MTTGERIKQARKNAGLTQTELANKIGVKFSTIHKYETGLIVNLKRETIASLAEALDVSPSWLMCIDDDLKALAEETVQLNELIDAFDSLPPELRTYALNQIKELSRLSKSQDGSAESQ